MNEIFWLKLTLCFHQRWDGGSWSRASLIYFANTSHCQNNTIIVDFLWLPAIKQKLVFLFPSLFMLMTIKGDLKKKKKKTGQPKSSKRMSVILLATSCLWSAKRSWWWMGLWGVGGWKQTLLLCSVTQTKRDVGGNQVICVQDIWKN